MRSVYAVLLRPEWRCAVLVVLVSSLLPIGPLLSQRPVPTPRVNALPPRPDSISVEHLPRGGIIVKWTEVPVAKGYFLGRSRGNEGWRRIQVPLRGPGATHYTDHDVHPGVRYRYQVATIDSADRVSLRVNSDTIVGRLLRVSSPPGNVTATVTGPGQVTVRWLGVYGATQYRVERRADPQPAGAASPPIQIVGRTSIVDQIGSGDADRTVFYIVTGLVSGPGGEPGPPGRSNQLIIPGRSTDTSSAPGADTADDDGTASAASSSVLVTIAPGASVRVGANARLAAGAGAQWLSLDPGIATATPDGAVVGRAPGEAQIVAISRGADGAVRVSVMRVIVAP